MRGYIDDSIYWKRIILMRSVNRDRWTRFGSIIKGSRDWICLGVETEGLEDADGPTAWYSKYCYATIGMRKQYLEFGILLSALLTICIHSQHSDPRSLPSSEHVLSCVSLNVMNTKRSLDFTSYGCLICIPDNGGRVL
jgi:hypothetical protein